MRDAREMRSARDTREDGVDKGEWNASEERGAGRETVRETGRETGRETEREAGREAGRETGREAGRDNNRIRIRAKLNKREQSRVPETGQDLAGSRVGGLAG